MKVSIYKGIRILNMLEDGMKMEKNLNEFETKLTNFIFMSIINFMYMLEPKHCLYKC